METLYTHGDYVAVSSLFSIFQDIQDVSLQLGLQFMIFWGETLSPNSNSKLSRSVISKWNTTEPHIYEKINGHIKKVKEKMVDLILIFLYLA